MNSVRNLLAVPVVAALMWSAAAHGHDYKVADIKVVHPWARATPSTARTGAAFMTIRNGAARPDRLIAVRSGVSRKVGLHRSFMEDNIMKMRPVDAIEVPAEGVVALKPGGYHVMFMGLEQPFLKGKSFPLTLIFERAGEIEVSVEIEKVGANGGHDN